MSDSGATPVGQRPAAESGFTAVRFEHTSRFVSPLEELRVSLAVTTYQAGKLAIIGTHQGEISISIYNFEQAMGLALTPDGIAVGTKRQIWALTCPPGLGCKDSARRHDACFLTRREKGHLRRVCRSPSIGRI